MPGWAIWVVVGLGIWLVLSLTLALLVSRSLAVLGATHDEAAEEEQARLALKPERLPAVAESARRRILLVDDDADLRLLLRTTIAADECAVEEAGSAEEAAELARFWRPSAVVLDVGLPGMSGLTFCRELKQRDVYGSPGVILLTGGETSAEDALQVGAEALLRKPFSPLDLMATIDYALEGSSKRLEAAEAEGGDQLLAYARDLGRLAQVERAQRRLLQHAYRQTITALTDALEVRNQATGHHALRVHRYAVELTEALEPSLLDDPSLEYGFLLHDIGKIGVPDSILDKKGPLGPEELLLMQRHPLIGAELLSDVPLLDGEGLQVVRSHHERWDGRGYPDGLEGDEIPLGARIFALADALDAMTSERPYHRTLSWDSAVEEVLRGSGSQFDPQVVRVFALREQRLHRTQHDLAHTA
jgi:response regulator RpfG family c-di-GMP phosphodiesterase